MTDRIQRKRKLIAKHIKELNQLLEQCTHEDTVPKSYYFEGSYLDRAYTETWDECTVCGHRMNEKRKTHDYYG